MPTPQWILPESSVSLWCYVFYVSKYYELLDTLFILLKNKKPRFVQVRLHFGHFCVTVFWTFGYSSVLRAPVRRHGTTPAYCSSSGLSATRAW